MADTRYPIATTTAAHPKKQKSNTTNSKKEKELVSLKALVEIPHDQRNKVIWQEVCDELKVKYPRKGTSQYVAVLAVYKDRCEKADAYERKYPLSEDKIAAFSQDDQIKYLWRTSCYQAKIKPWDAKKGTIEYDKVKAIFDEKRDQLNPHSQVADNTIVDEESGLTADEFNGLFNTENTGSVFKKRKSVSNETKDEDTETCADDHDQNTEDVEDGQV
jgi:hypothetical protein